jgi:hypothetical protein
LRGGGLLVFFPVVAKADAGATTFLSSVEEEDFLLSILLVDPLPLPLLEEEAEAEAEAEAETDLEEEEEVDCFELEPLPFAADSAGAADGAEVARGIRLISLTNRSCNVHASCVMSSCCRANVMLIPFS